MLDITQYTISKKSSEKSFGYVFSIFFLILFFYQLYFNQNVNLYFILISMLLFLFSLFIPKVYFYPNLFWIKIGELISHVISPVIMFLIFILAFFTTKFFLFLFNKKLMDDRFDYKLDTYWKSYQKNKGKMKDQF